MNQEIVEGIFLGLSSGQKRIALLPAMANRHGLIAGATGTGKTVTLQLLAENFSRLGVSVFSADVKGDLAGLSRPANRNSKIEHRLEKLKLTGFQPQAAPVVFWDLAGINGHPLRTTIAAVGPLLLAHILDLNDTQEGVLQVAFKVAEEEQLLLLDMKDLQSVLNKVAEESTEISARYGRVAVASVTAIQRKLLVLSESGADKFFGEPQLNIEHLMQHDFSGRGVISILAADYLIENPRLYSAFLFWFLSELFGELPEVGDQKLPRLVFFFDEAHLLFQSASKAFLQRIEQVVRLIRSKGVGLFFVTQRPDDIPEVILSQLGTKVQHALRAFTPKDRDSIKAVARNFRVNSSLDTEKVLTELAVGEALVSVLDESGIPTPVEQTLIAPPQSRIGAISDEERAETLTRSPMKNVYDQPLDRESAYEVLRKRQEGAEKRDPAKDKKSQRSNRQGLFETFFKSILRTIGGQLGREILRGIFKKK